MKKYLLFGWVTGGQGHGWQDFVLDYDTLEAARESAAHWEYYQILENGKVVEEWTAYAAGMLKQLESVE